MPPCPYPALLAVSPCPYPVLLVVPPGARLPTRSRLGSLRCWSAPSSAMTTSRLPGHRSGAPYKTDTRTLTPAAHTHARTKISVANLPLRWTCSLHAGRKQGDGPGRLACRSFRWAVAAEARGDARWDAPGTQCTCFSIGQFYVSHTGANQPSTQKCRSLPSSKTYQFCIVKRHLEHRCWLSDQFAQLRRPGAPAARACPWLSEGRAGARAGPRRRTLRRRAGATPARSPTTARVCIPGPLRDTHP